MCQALRRLFRREPTFFSSASSSPSLGSSSFSVDLQQVDVKSSAQQCFLTASSTATTPRSSRGRVARRSFSSGSRASRGSASSNLTAGFLADEDAIDQECAEEQARLEQALVNSEFREGLIHELLACHVKGSKEIHFVFAVHELHRDWSEHTKKEQALKARKLVEIFFLDNSVFKLDDTSSKLCKQLKSALNSMLPKGSSSGLLRILDRIKSETLDRLLMNQIVADHMKEFYGFEQSRELEDVVELAEVMI